MKILHLMLSNTYMDNVAYQENMLPRQNKLDGHEVKIIASTEIYDKHNRVVYVNPSMYINEYGIEVTRVPYKKYIPLFIAKKMRCYSNVYSMIEDFNPDVILHHGVQAYELLTIANYKKKHPKVKLYVDSHSDIYNSAKGYVSREILHRKFYGSILNKIIDDIDKIFYISLECKDFLKEMYNIPEYKTEFYPLGGEIFQEHERLNKRKKKREELGLTESQILMVHSGRMRKVKRTQELLQAFSNNKNKDFILLLIGNISKDISENINIYLENDSRIKYIGWRDGEEVFDYLCAADIYLQPGSQSATMQNAICCGCPVMIYPYNSHKPYLKGNGFYVKTIEDMTNVFNKIESNPYILITKGRASYNIAKELLDYKKLAERLYE